nr:hydroxyethylthiazole kinase [bacterium]
MLAEILNQNRRASPLVHCMTNYVTANDCANLLLASGASPIMADDLDEVAEITAACHALVLNMGTPSPRKFEAMLKAGQAANKLGHPVVLDPVGVGGSQLRKQAAQRLLQNVRVAVIRGNASEITTLVQGSMAHRGVDVDEAEQPSPQAALELARQLAHATGAVVVLTGAVDFVTDGRAAYRVMNGQTMMRAVTGTGCQLSALIGAYVSANPGKLLEAALAAVCAMGLCGEIAHSRLAPPDGNASYRNYIIDAMYNLTPDQLEKGAKYEIY